MVQAHLYGTLARGTAWCPQKFLEDRASWRQKSNGWWFTGSLVRYFIYMTVDWPRACLEPNPGTAGEGLPLWVALAGPCSPPDNPEGGCAREPRLHHGCQGRDILAKDGRGAGAQTQVPCLRMAPAQGGTGTPHWSLGLGAWP